MSNIIYQRNLGLFETQILRGSEKFPLSLPSMSPEAKMFRDHAKYINKRTSDYNRMYDNDLLTLRMQADQFGDKFTYYYKSTHHLMTDYDKEHVLPSTCALGIIKNMSTDFENLGSLGTNTSVTVSKEVFDSIVKYYQKYDTNDKSFTLSATRGKNMGYPWPIGGTNRALNDFLLGTSAALVVGNWKEKDSSLEGLYAKIRKYHGEPFSLEGSRTQHTKNERAAVIREGIHSTLNLQGRYRQIAQDPKLAVMDTRPEIKHMLGILLNTPVHNQDRKFISDFVTRYHKLGWFIVAKDYSKFDHHFGGLRGEQIVDLIGTIIKSEKFKKNTFTAFRTRSLIYGYRKVWEYPGNAVLKSGMGSTSLIGCVGAFTYSIAALSWALRMSPDRILSLMGTQWDLLDWGDDSVFAFKDPKWSDALTKGLAHFKLKVEDEPTIKYLGSNYAKGSFKGTMDLG